MNRRELARLIDHTCLVPDATAARIDALCDEAVEHGMRVCVAPVWVTRAVRRLRGACGVVSVAGFPLGSSTTAIKVEESRRLVLDGATEVDMVIAIGALKGGDDGAVASEIAAVADVVHAGPGRGLKVILETALLTTDEIVRGCRIAEGAGADFVKTSTGFAASGATVEAVTLMRSTVSPAVGVKAAGGIRDYATAMAMIGAGAARIGSSASVNILRGAPA